MMLKKWMNADRTAKICSTCVISVLFAFFYSSCSKPPVTFNNVAPILYKNCSSCHHTRGNAPFSLVTYDEVFRKSKLIKYVTQEHLMPPWPADTAYSHFAG